MSGGVDSSVAALLLLQQGYDVTGVTMKLRPDQYMAESQSGGCCSLDDIDDARRVAYRLGIEHLVLNFTQVFSEKVIDYFASEYLAGRTPNPASPATLTSNSTPCFARLCLWNMTTWPLGIMR